MTHQNIIERYLEYAEGHLEPTAKREIDQHLDSCASCARAYRLFAQAVSPMPDPVRSLKADPFLPTRIKAIAEQQNRTDRLKRAVRFSFASLALAAAVYSGILLGKAIVSATATSSTDIATEFASSITASDLSDQWSSAIDNGNGGQQ